MSEGYDMNFNQDFTSLSVLSHTGFRLFSINGKDNIDEIFVKDTEHIRLVERLFNSSLVVLVTLEKPNCLKMLHFKKKQDICNCVYPTDILSVRMNRQRLVVCLAESIHIHDIRDMKILHSIEHIEANPLGLCSLALNSQLAYPSCSSNGELRIFNANKLRPGLTLKAHDSPLSALCFSSSGALLATASERGTVIRVFCARTGQRIQEFRRGVKRCVRIASLVFSPLADFLCASSNTETVHIFKIDGKAVSALAAGSPEDGKKCGAEKAAKPLDAPSGTSPASSTDSAGSGNGNGSGTGWGGYFSKAVSSYLPSQVCDVLAQDRAFATAVLAQPGLKHVCGLVRLQKELKLLIACEDGFLYVYGLNLERGGPCKLQRVHDLRYTLDGIIELDLTESMNKTFLNADSNEESLPATIAVTTATEALETASKSTCVSVLIQNPEPAPDHSYAGILRGEKAADTLTADSAKYRKLCDAIDTPTKLFDERQFPPVAIVAKD